MPGTTVALIVACLTGCAVLKPDAPDALAQACRRWAGLEAGLLDLIRPENR